jgi:hypothetical protein
MSDELTMDDLPAYDTPEMPDQEEAEYDGRTVTLYDPFRIDDDEKKFAVYVRNPDSGNVNKLKFGSDSMEIKRDEPGRLKSFRERFSCDEYGQSDKHKATFWSCLFWRKDLDVSDILSENKIHVKESTVRQIVREELQSLDENYFVVVEPGVGYISKNNMGDINYRSLEWQGTRFDTRQDAQDFIDRHSDVIDAYNAETQEVFTQTSRPKRY